MQKIKIGIVGYGNLGKGVEYAINNSIDMKLISIITRRDINSIKSNTSNIIITHLNDIQSLINKVDIMILCGGSATDLPELGPKIANYFSTVDSFDTHAEIPKYFNNIHKIALNNHNVSIISVGWDPGMFSINRLYNECILPKGHNYTFWGKGISQGHSDAIRRIDGVLDAKQYTIPIQNIIDNIKKGLSCKLESYNQHIRECFVVVKKNADKFKIEKTIKEMPHYFDKYKTIVHFITEDELKKEHSKMPHGGNVIRTGYTSEGNHHTIEYSLKLDSNPEFTANVLVAYARAAFKLKINKNFGAKTVFDIPPYMLSNKSYMHLIQELL